MKNPNFDYETKLIKSGFRRICGIDEVGRGPLAGPVVACAVSIDKDLILDDKAELFGGIKDSKKMSAGQRERWFKFLTSEPSIKRGIGIVSEKVIDKINILEATKLAMAEALEKIKIAPDFLYSPKIMSLENEKGVREKGVSPLRKTGSEATARNRGVSGKYNISPSEIYILIDGNFTLENIFLNQKAVARGDAKIISIAAASIIAKVTRDRIMLEYHKKYPEYRFDKHKGYGTKKHIEMVKKQGVCPIHRRSFEPIKSLTKR